jgi:hypothetical protein
MVQMAEAYPIDKKNTSEIEITSEFEWITPEIAKTYLKLNHGNRTFSKDHANRLANNFKRGHYIYDGSPIRFDTKGHLRDGQHRLSALVQANLSLQFNVIRNLSEEAFYVMDTGRSRSVGDIIGINGIPNGIHTAALSRAVLSWRTSSNTSRNPLDNFARAFDAKDVKEFYDTNPELLKDCLKRASRISGKVGGTKRVWGAFLYRLLSEGASNEDVEKFEQCVKEGKPSDASNATHVLYESLFRNAKRNQGKLTAHELLALIVKAWKSYIKGEDIGQLKWQSGGAKPEKEFPSLLILK